jgi:hypothetical protein
MANNGLLRLIGQWKKIWGPLAGAATGIFGVVGTFFLPPPAIAHEAQWPSLAKVVITVCVGFLVLMGFVFSKKKYWTGWVVVALLFLVAAVGSIFAYQNLTDSSTCTYQGTLVVIGKTYTPHGAEYVKENPGISCGDLIDRHVGKTEDVWTKDSIDRARLKLVAVYIACMPLFTICGISVLQAIYCLTGGRR